MNKYCIFWLVDTLVLFVSTGVAHADTPDEFRRRQQREMEEFRNERLAESQAFRDSINREYAHFIEQQWKEMSTFRQTIGFNPPPLAFAPRSSNMLDIPRPKINPEPQRPVSEHGAIRLSENEAGQKALFYGKVLTLCADAVKLPHLRSASGKDIADYWRALSVNASGIMKDMSRIERELNLDDWGAYQLAYELAPYFIENITPNERVVFSVFALCQRGFACRLGESNGKLYPLLATENELFNKMYIEFPRESARYYIISNDKLGSVNVCSADFPMATRKLDITPPRTLPCIGGIRSDIQRTWRDYHGEEYACKINYDPEIIRYLDSYPCIDFVKYVDGPSDQIGMDILFEQLEAQMHDMDIKAKLNYLLHFVQFAFPYKTDGENYGYEKWNFPEATLASDFCDCDDRAILWCKLVRELVDVPLAFVHYPKVHLAAAVAIEPTPGCATVKSGSRIYVLCDPTYIGADVGMEMPSLTNIGRTVIPLP